MDPDGELMTEEWSYPSIVGMLLYLSTNTRPDIAFAVSQVARFSYSPKQSHASAVKQIVCYLSHTWDKGTIVKPTNTLQLDCYVDADFAGLYKCDPDASPTSAKLLGEVTQMKDGRSKNLTRTRNVPPKCNKQATNKILSHFYQLI
jgi:hypothetical protein